MSLLAITRHLIRGVGLHGTTAAHLRVTSGPIPPPIDLVGPDSVVRSLYPNVPIPECGVYQHVFLRIESNGRKVAIVDGISGREYCFNQLHESVVRRAGGGGREIASVTLRIQHIQKPESALQAYPPMPPLKACHCTHHPSRLGLPS